MEKYCELKIKVILTNEYNECDSYEYDTSHVSVPEGASIVTLTSLAIDRALFYTCLPEDSYPRVDSILYHYS